MTQAWDPPPTCGSLARDHVVVVADASDARADRRRRQIHARMPVHGAAVGAGPGLERPGGSAPWRFSRTASAAAPPARRRRGSPRRRVRARGTRDIPGARVASSSCRHLITDLVRVVRRAVDHAWVETGCLPGSRSRRCRGAGRAAIVVDPCADRVHRKDASPSTRGARRPQRGLGGRSDGHVAASTSATGGGTGSVTMFAGTDAGSTTSVRRTDQEGPRERDVPQGVGAAGLDSPGHETASATRACREDAQALDLGLPGRASVVMRPSRG